MQVTYFFPNGHVHVNGSVLQPNADGQTYTVDQNSEADRRLIALGAIPQSAADSGFTSAQVAGLQALVSGAVVSAITTVDATQLIDGQSITALGYATAYDNGSHEFVYSASSTATVDGGIVIAPAVGTGRLLRKGYTVLGFNGPIKPEFWGATYGNDLTYAVSSSAAINSAFAYLRSNLGGKIDFAPAKIYYIDSTINATVLFAKRVEINGNNCTFILATNGADGFDAMGSTGLHWYNINLATGTTNLPRIGIKFGRIANSVAAANNSFFNVSTVAGSQFTLSVIYNLASEICYYNKLILTNAYPSASCYSVILDGLNTFGITSNFVTMTVPANTLQSFNENIFENCSIVMSAGANTTNGTPIWMGGTRRHRWIGSYTQSYYLGHNVTLYSYSSSDRNWGLHFDCHSEAQTTDVFFITGPNNTPLLAGFTLIDQNPQATNSVLKCDTNITSVIMHDVDVQICQDNVSPPTYFFDNPALFTCSGKVYIGQANCWNLPDAQFLGGSVNQSGSVKQYGNGSNMTLPTILQASSISGGGAVATISIDAVGTPAYIAIPTIVFTNPPSGGSAASATVATMTFKDPGSLANAGTGYTINDILTLVGGTFSVAGKIKVNTVDGAGRILTYGRNQANSVYTVLPTGTLSVTGGTGTGAQFSGCGYNVNTVTLVGGGGGFLAPPTATATGTLSSGSTYQTFSTTLSGLLQVYGGIGQINCDNTGTKLGEPDQYGGPVQFAQPQADLTLKEVALTTAGYTVPQNCGRVRFNQTGTIASATITLPTAFNTAIAQQLKLSTAGTVTALTFSPALPSWTNGTTWSAYSGMTLVWSPTSLAWFREQ